LEKKYSNDTLHHVLYDLKGNSIWFNYSFMEVFHRTSCDYLKINIFDVMDMWNPEHPVGSLIKCFFQNQGKELEGKTKNKKNLNLKLTVEPSEMMSSIGILMSIKAKLSRIDAIGEPFGYLICFQALNISKVEKESFIDTDKFFK